MHGHMIIKKKICFWHVIWQICLNFLNKNVCVSVLRQGCLNVNLCSACNMLTLTRTVQTQNIPQSLVTTGCQTGRAQDVQVPWAGC